MESINYVFSPATSIEVRKTIVDYLKEVQTMREIVQISK